MIVRRNYRHNYFKRRRIARVRFLLILTSMTVAAFVAIALNLDKVQTATAAYFGMAAQPTLYPAEYAMRGSEAYRRGNMEDASREFERAVTLQPENVAYLYEYGVTLIEMGQTERAVEIAERAIAASPDDVRGYALKANALAYDDPTNAIITASQGVEIDPNFAPLWSAQAIANTMIYRFNQALIAGERATELDPGDPNTHRAYAVPLLWTGDTPGVISELEMATSINPNLPGPWFELAAQFKRQDVNNPRRALAIYEYMVSNLTMSRDDTAKAYLRICETYAAADQADFAAAQRNCERALEVRPNYGSAFRELGRMQYVRRNYEGSILTFQTCARLDPAEVPCFAYRGLAHYWMNQCDEAWQVLNEAQTLGTEQGVEFGLMEQIQIGIENVIERCPDYNNYVAPTAPPPTLIPPTPIGGL